MFFIEPDVLRLSSRGKGKFEFQKQFLFIVPSYTMKLAEMREVIHVTVVKIFSMPPGR